MSLAKEAGNKRQDRRRRVDEQWETHYHPQRKRPNEKSRSAGIDLARLDIAAWLADPNRVVVVVPVQRQPTSPTTGADRQPESNDQSNRSLGDAPESHEPQPGPADPDDQPENHSRPDSQPERSERDAPGDVPPRGPEDRSRPESQPERSERNAPGDVLPCPSPVEQVVIFAEAMTKSIWPDIVAELGGDTQSARDIKRQLANHGWCDLFIGLVQVIEGCRTALDTIPESAKSLVKQAILGSSMQAKRPCVTSAVVDIVVDRVWRAFTGAMCGHVPLLSIITGEDALRSLRILAVFTCPAPEKHKEVREHALKPLSDDTKTILIEQTKTRLAKLFDEWVTDGDKLTFTDMAGAALTENLIRAAPPRQP